MRGGDSQLQGVHVSAYPTWTPAPRPGIIPLHPLGFGTIMGRSFAALRHNPRVLFGFALTVQAVMYIVTIAAVGATTVSAFSRLDTVPAGSEDYQTILIGSGWMIGIVGLIMTLLSLGVQVLVQGVVIVEVTHATVAEKLTVREIWQRVRPVAWRLVGYTLLLIVAILVVVVAVVLIVWGLTTVAGGLGILLGILAGLAAIPLYVWINTKLILVPSVMVIERARIFEAMRRSWRLTKTRFWPTFGLIFLIGLIFSAAGQLVSTPFSILGSGVLTIFTPTGDPSGSLTMSIVFLCLSYVVALIVQSVSLIVTSTASALIYIDCRMRHEGLDIDLLAYVEKRDAGEAHLPDPWTQHIGRDIAPRGPWAPAYAGPQYPAGQNPYAQAGYPQPYGSVPPVGGPRPGWHYPAPQYPAAQAAPQSPAAQAAPPYPAPSYPAPPPAAPQYPAPVAPAPQPPTPEAPAPSSTQWAAPGADQERP